MSLGNVNLSLDLYFSPKPLPIAAATSSKYEDCPYTAKKALQAPDGAKGSADMSLSLDYMRSFLLALNCLY